MSHFHRLIKLYAIQIIPLYNTRLKSKLPLCKLGDNTFLPVSPGVVHPIAIFF